MAIMERYGQHNCAGYAHDKFHKNVMLPHEMAKDSQGWRTAWKGRVVQALTDLNSIYPDKTLVLIALAGGPECDFERGQLFNGKIASSFPNGYKLKQIGDLDELVSYFGRGAPIPQ